jgi:uncharacterized repeat protein (TIGR03803 family)
VFKLNKDGSAYSVLYSFSTNAVDGQRPQAALLKGSDGAFYGTTAFGGANNKGTVFRLSVPIAAPNLALMHSNSTIILSWPFPSAGFALESTPSLSSPNWQPAPEMPITNNARLVVTMAANQSERYFRLHKP